MEYARALKSIGEIIQERNIELVGGDVLTVKGYTQAPNHVLVSDRLSPGAKLAFAMLLKYMWEKDYCFPGQERLAADMGVTRQSANTYIQELQREQFIEVKRRRQGRPNLYRLIVKRKPRRRAA